ncbi:MAG TPA: hypothetical protein DEB25_06400 [Desulfobulbaceae bacterium]|nr:hypothetical protein [Desulfobulbaceae bacterium]
MKNNGCKTWPEQKATLDRGDKGGKVVAKGEKKPPRLPHSEARVQFISNLEEIKQMLTEGYSMRRTYSTLRDAGKITMSVRTFIALCRQQ